MSLSWRGDEIIKRVRDAAKAGINDTMAAAVLHAKENHPFQNRTSTLEGSVRIETYATERGADEVYGRWGSVDVVYAMRIELGFQGKDAMGRMYNQRAFSFLRPAADVEYPKLAGRIRRHFGHA
jgi:hypothetical protein